MTALRQTTRGHRVRIMFGRGNARRRLLTYFGRCRRSGCCRLLIVLFGATGGADSGAEAGESVVTGSAAGRGIEPVGSAAEHDHRDGFAGCATGGSFGCGEPPSATVRRRSSLASNADCHLHRHRGQLHAIQTSAVGSKTHFDQCEPRRSSPERSTQSQALERRGKIIEMIVTYRDHFRRHHRQEQISQVAQEFFAQREDVPFEIAWAVALSAMPVSAPTRLRMNSERSTESSTSLPPAARSSSADNVSRGDRTLRGRTMWSSSENRHLPNPLDVFSEGVAGKKVKLRQSSRPNGVFSLRICCRKRKRRQHFFEHLQQRS